MQHDLQRIHKRLCPIQRLAKWQHSCCGRRINRRAKKDAPWRLFWIHYGHLKPSIVGHTTWLNRLTNTPYTIEPLSKSSTAFAEWDTYKETRINMDQRLLRWSLEIDEPLLNCQLHYKTSTGADNALPTWLVITHLFNHQTHHRGQVHCMLTQLGITPPDTDVLYIEQFQK